MSKERLEYLINDLPSSIRHSGELESLKQFAREQAERSNKNAQDLDDMDRQLYATQQKIKRYLVAIEKAENVLRQDGIPIAVAKHTALMNLQQVLEESE